MITRLEIDGFKSFAKFAVDLPALVAIVGPNASGKSNIFDAMQLLSRVVTMPVAQALALGRGEPAEQFRRRGDGSRVDEMSFAVELLVAPVVDDAFGSHEQIRHTRFRYEITLGRRPDDRGSFRPFVLHESIRPIKKGTDRFAETVGPNFAQEHLLYKGSQWKILDTEKRDDGKAIFRLSASKANNSQGRPRELPADRAVSSVLSSITTALDHPVPFAVRQEIASWRFLQLEPTSLRGPSPVGSPTDHLSSSGGNLSWVLELIRRAAASEDAPGLDDVAADLARVISGFSAVEVTQNEARGQWELALRSRDEGEVSARVASDGTIRLLALLTALYEPGAPGVLCMEEPENGINPQRLTAMLQVLRGLVTDTTGSGEGRQDRLVQLLLSSHSPLLPLVLRAGELLVVDGVGFSEHGVDGASRITRARHIRAEGSATRVEQMRLGGADWPALPPGTETRLPGITREDAERIVNSA